MTTNRQRRAKRSTAARRDLGIALGAVLPVATGPLHAQVGERAVKFILPVATASGVDTITRAASPALSKALGHPVVVENQPGAGGIVGTSALVKSAPDGFTLSIVSNNHVIYPSVYKSLPFDPIADITPIAVIGSTPIVIVVNPKVPAKNAQELDRAAEGEARRVQLRVVRQRHDPAPRRGDVPGRGRREGDARPLQGRRADADRPDRRAGRDRRALAALDPAAPEERRAARDRRRHGDASRRRAGDSDHGRAGHAGLPGRRLVRDDRSGEAARGGGERGSTPRSRRRSRRRK